MSADARERVHKNCPHRRYRLSCEQIDELRSEANERCQICGVMERYLWGRLLQIDHDKKLGYWAVRGLLCPSCNTRLDRGSLVGPEVDHYLANPWHKRLPYSHLINPEAPEPDSEVLDWETALRLVTEAAGPYKAKREYGSAVDRRATRAALADAVRAAARAGIPRKEIAAATDGAWSYDYLYVILKERRKQPNRLAEAVANARRLEAAS